MSATSLSNKHSTAVNWLSRWIIRPAAYVGAFGIALVTRVRVAFNSRPTDKNSLRNARRLEKQRRKELWRKERASRHRPAA